MDSHLEHGAQAIGQGCLLALLDRRRDFDADDMEFGELRVWIEPGRVITGRWHPLAGTDQMRFRCDLGEAPAGVADFVQDLLETIVGDFELVSRNARQSLDRTEDDILDDRIEGAAAKLGAVRRNAVHIRRRVHPLRQLIARLRDILPAWVLAEERRSLDSLAARLDRLLADLHDCQEQCRLLADESQARYNERNSRNLYILSVITAVLLPLNIVTGIFGMNVGGLPGLDHPGAFVWVILGMVATALGVVGLFKLKRWF